MGSLIVNVADTSPTKIASHLRAKYSKELLTVTEVASECGSSATALYKFIKRDPTNAPPFNNVGGCFNRCHVDALACWLYTNFLRTYIKKNRRGRPTKSEEIANRALAKDNENCTYGDHS